MLMSKENVLKPRVEILDHELNNWITTSTHKNEENAIINADVILKSRKCRARVIYKGNIVFEVHNDQKEV